MSDQRYIEIETKLSHHDMGIEELNETVREQQRSIDELTLTVAKLAGRLEAHKEEGLDIGPADEKPPHY
jgi:SlyX protein